MNIQAAFSPPAASGFSAGRFSAPTTSVTTVYTEEREEGIASFRCMTYGDVSHLYAAKEPVSFSGRFCETFDDPTERH